MPRGQYDRTKREPVATEEDVAEQRRPIADAPTDRVIRLFKPTAPHGVLARRRETRQFHNGRWNRNAFWVDPCTNTKLGAGWTEWSEE